MPVARNAPKLWPPVPSIWMKIVWSGRPSGRWRTSSPDSIAPTVRLTLRVSSMNWTFSPRSMAGLHFSIRRMSSARSRPWSCSSTCRRGTSAGASTWWKMRLKSRPRAFQCSTPFLGVEQIAAPDQVIELADAELRHDLAHFGRDEEEVVDDMLGLALELAAQHRVLRRDADRAGVQVALAHHDAAFGDERRGRESELVGAEQAQRSQHRGPSSSGRRPARGCGRAAGSARAFAASRQARAPTACQRA